MQPTTIDTNQFDQLIIQRLPILMRQNRQIQELVLELARENFAERKETEDRFYQILGELKRDREEQARKWDEQNRKWKEYTEEQNRKWDEQNLKWKEYTEEQNRKWEEQNRKWKEYTEEQNHKWDEQSHKWDETKQEFQKVHEEFQKMHEAIMKIAQKQDHSFGAIGARWGIKSENSFRKALAGILERSFDVKVLNITDYDDEGMVFGRPDQVELDIVIKNGLLIICEIKSSIGKAEMYIFERKVRFYEKRHQKQANRMIVISPMVDANARPVAEILGIEVYSDSSDVESL